MGLPTLQQQACQWKAQARAPRYFSKHCCFCKFFAPPHRLSHKSGRGCRPALTWALVITGQANCNSNNYLGCSDFTYSCRSSFNIGKSLPRITSAGRVSTTPIFIRYNCPSISWVTSTMGYDFVTVHTLNYCLRHNSHYCCIHDIF